MHSLWIQATAIVVVATTALSVISPSHALVVNNNDDSESSQGSSLSIQKRLDTKPFDHQSIRTLHATAGSPAVKPAVKPAQNPPPSTPTFASIVEASLPTPTTKPIAKLDLFDLEAVIRRRQRLVSELIHEKNRLEWEDDKGKNKDAVDLIDSRIKRLYLLEDVIRSSLDIYGDIVRNQNVTHIDKLMESESLMIVDKFQNLVLKAKNDHLAIVETQKVLDKSTKLKQDTQQDLKNNAPSTNSSSTGAQDNGGMAANMVGSVIKDVSNQADKLESSMKEDSFIESQKSEGTTVETVLKVHDSGKQQGNSSSKSKSENVTPTLIDSHNNQYVLSKSGDTTAHVEDTRLLNDILLLLMACFTCVSVLHLLGLPSFFGYILAGVILGPPGYIKNAVQVETISRGLGVIFIMFFLGLEFNVTKIRKVWSVSVGGSAVLLFVTVLCVVLIGYKFESRLGESLIVGASLFLSSTAVVLNFLKTGEAETQYGRTIIGVLISQDVLLGFLLALMPALQTSGLDALFTVLQLILSLAGFLCACLVISFPAIRMLQYLMPVKGSGNEIYLLASIGFCLMVINVGSFFEQSMELCCFVAGVMISTRKSLSDTTVHVTDSLRGMFSALFFASIGLHIYPSFLLNEGLLLISLTVLVVVFKIGLAILVFKFLFRLSWSTALTVGIGLGQISEFTFVLASKAKSLDLVSRETFYILLGVTTLSMIISPALWYLGSMLDGRSANSEATLKRAKASHSDAELQVLID
ncbi:hypothetical protein BASA61_009063 [Batrachochytrium salamandrivorans]|nr:hypothetical protein BASA61_009063 [Batrachochytrium salamandrivorans]KAH9265393.1 hypothetical protein BASA84_001666 [Batrachochytrium salamandrivorans]